MRVVRNLAGVLVGLCIAATATGSTPMRVEVRSGALELSLAVSRTAFRVGEEIPLVFSLRNVSEAAAFIQSFPPRFFDFSVYAADGALVRKPTFVGRPIMAPPIGRMLRPGETITATITWQPWMLDPTGRRVRPRVFLAILTFWVRGVVYCDHLNPMVSRCHSKGAIFCAGG